MVVGDLPVDASVEFQASASEISVNVPLLNVFVLSYSLLHDITDLAFSGVGSIDASENIDASRAVIGVEQGIQIIVVLPGQRLRVGEVGIEAEALSLALDGAYPHHRAHGRVVLRSRIADHLHALDLVAEEPVQFGGVSDAAAVDVNHGGALAYDLYAVLALDESRDLAQDVPGRAGILQHGAAHGSRQALTGDGGLGHHGLDDGLAEQFGILLHAYGREFHLRCGEADGLPGVLVSYQ